MKSIILNLIIGIFFATTILYSTEEVKDARITYKEVLIAENPIITPVDSSIYTMMELMPLLDFNSFEVEGHEGCTDSFVYPGGASGPTISCGLDIGNIGYTSVAYIMPMYVSDSILKIMLDGTKIRGKETRQWIKKNQIHLGDKEAVRLCNALKKYIWRLLVMKYPNLRDAPSDVKTVMLDFAFNSGVGTPRMAGFGNAISKKDWYSLGVLVQNAYVDYAGTRYHSIYRRRVEHGQRLQYIDNAPADGTYYD